jgi:hypothetical protein
MRVPIVVAMAGAVAVALAGCSPAEGGQPTVAPGTGTGPATPPSESAGSQPTAPPSADSTYGAPRVSDPLDASRFLARPCDVLTPAQLTTFGISKPGRPTTTGATAENAGPFCTWTADSEVNSTVGVGFITGNKHGLSDIYRGRSRFEYFEETTVEGYPAVFASLNDGRAQGVCDIGVGISDTLIFRSTEQGGRKGQGSCDRVKQVAAAVVATVKVSA